MDRISTFNEKLIDWETKNPFPYVDPPRGWKPPFIVGSENYLKWFNAIFRSTIGQGYWISFIVGDPGAGKSHLTCYLDYLFNDTGNFRGLYSAFSAGQSKITSMELWMDFFLNTDVINKTKQWISIQDVETHNLRSKKVKEHVRDYIQGTLQIDNLTENEVQSMASAISTLLSTKNVGMCMVIDNVDEYFRYLVTLRQSSSSNMGNENDYKQQELNDLQNFFGTLRTTCRDMPNFLLLVACTTPIYDIIKRHAITVDRTLAGRIQYQSEVLQTLSLGQAYELVNKYMSWWCEDNDLELPIVDECTKEDTDGKNIQLYPFSKSAIEEIQEVTGKYARDLKMICNECINRMKIEQEAWIVKDKYLAIAIEDAQRKQPQIIPEENLSKFTKRRSQWMQETMKMKLEKEKNSAKSRYRLGIDNEKLLEKMTIYSENLGILSETPSSLRNRENPSNWIDTKALRIWKYSETKRVLVSFIFTTHPPLGKTLYRYITWKDLSDAISYVDANIVTHIMFITHWSGGFHPSTMQYYHKTSQYEPIMEILPLDDHLFKIIGAVEAENSNERKDLIEHVDAYHLKLKASLDRLVTKSMPEEQPEKKDRKDVGYF